MDDATPAELKEAIRSLRIENAALRAASEALHRRAEDSVTQLLEAQRMESVGRMVAGLAHNFNNLLMGINGCCRAEKELQPGTPAAEMVSEVHRAINAGMALTRELLAFSSGSTAEPGPEDLNVVVQRSRAILQAMVGDAIAVTVQPADEHAVVRLHHGQLEQVLLNLAANARDAMPDGGRPDIGVEVSPERVLLSVRDSGPGMDAATSEQAFTPFFTTKGESGTGLGLATVNAIVRRSGGSITIESEPGHGTCLLLNFPRCCATAPPFLDRGERLPHFAGPEPMPTAERQPAQARTAPPTASASPLVLLVEDDRLVRMTVHAWLEAFGATVPEAATIDDALRVAAEHAADLQLVLTDMILPGGDGRHLKQTLQADIPHLRFAFMSAYSHDQLLADGRIAAGDRTLEKPFSEADLVALLRQILPS